MKAIIDRFEGEFAVCETENGKMMNIRRDTIPQEAKEGDVLQLETGGAVIDKEETAARRRRIRKLMDDLWK